MQFPEQLIQPIAIPETLHEYEQMGLHLWKKSEASFNMYFFSIVLNEESLSNHWSDLTAKIALHFQTTLDKEIELWNIYIFFFTDKPVASELKYKIEHDHYCARKTVFDYLNFPTGISPEDVQKVIYDKLFDLSIELFDENESIFSEIEDEIREINPELIDLEHINKIIAFYKGSADE